MKKLHILLLLTPLSIIAFLSAFPNEKNEKTPNIVLIFMDDLGDDLTKREGKNRRQSGKID